MEIYRADIIQLLRSRGRNDKASAAESQLPERVDVERDKWVLARYGIDSRHLLSALVPSEVREPGQERRAGAE